MQDERVYPIAGPTDHPTVGAAARNARNLILLRDRLQKVTQAAIPPHRRRPAKGAGKWPGRIPLDSL